MHVSNDDKVPPLMFDPTCNYINGSCSGSESKFDLIREILLCQSYSFMSFRT